MAGISKKNRCIILVVSGIVIAAVIAGIIATVVTLQNYKAKASKTDAPSPGNQSPSLEELSRIDCFPEAQGGVEMVSNEACWNRSCEYKESKFPHIPPCYFPQHSHGYFVIQRTETNLGFDLELFRQDPFPFPGDVRKIVFRVEQRSDHLLRFVKFGEDICDLMPPDTCS